MHAHLLAGTLKRQVHAIILFFHLPILRERRRLRHRKHVQRKALGAVEPALHSSVIQATTATPRGAAAAQRRRHGARYDRRRAGRGVQRARHDVAVRGEPVRQRVVDAALVDVADGHGRAPRLPCHSGGEESDGAGADHERRRAGFGPPAVHGVDGDREGLQERGGGEADVVGESKPGILVRWAVQDVWMDGAKDSLVAPLSWVVDPLLQRALEVWEALCAAPEAHFLAEVVPPFPADSALAARDADLEGYAIAEGKAAHVRTDGNDHTRGLMAERQRLARAQVAIGKLLEVGYIGATYARGMYGDLKLPGSWLIDGSSFLYDCACGGQQG